MEVFRGTLLLLLQLLHLDKTDGVRCFSHFVPASLSCEGEDMGDVDKDICCLNPKYSYKTEDRLCHSCGPPFWSSWSSWSQCNTLCGAGVRLRRRSCYGVGQSECEKTGDKLEAEGCEGTCCDGEGWSQWSLWSVCSVSCGEDGVMTRNRKCTDRTECALACATGDAMETQSCPVHTCPVHGGWSDWSVWSECSGTCIHGNVPTRGRGRTCSRPPPSVLPPGDACRGDSEQIQSCTELPHCAVHGSWGAWSDPGPCSVTCGEGLQLSLRSCNQPSPQYGGRYCAGPSSKTSVCSSPCPVPSFWADWSQWSECSRMCAPDGGEAPVRTRRRSCFNPGGSASCEGPELETSPCPGISFCHVHGSWGSWSSFSPCPVTCGVALQVSTRSCNSPTPKHGGQHCHGDGVRHQLCNTQQPCPVDGVWSEWTPWRRCEDVFDPSYPIQCEVLVGSQSRERICLHRALGGAACPLGPLSESRGCYDVEGCLVKGQWNGWEPWSKCRPPCGNRSKRTRKMNCQPNYKDYSASVGDKQEPVAFVGTPLVDCGSPATKEMQKCENAPPC